MPGNVVEPLGFMAQDSPTIISDLVGVRSSEGCFRLIRKEALKETPHSEEHPPPRIRDSAYFSENPSDLPISKESCEC
ncbi:hypothetical protein NUACC26_068280 [Scytonema sp. NUACC26]